MGKYACQRFGQLLINLGIAKDCTETWIMEDDKLELHLKIQGGKNGRRKRR